MIAKCSCQHCNGTIEFDTTELVEENSVVPCPHCGLETKLSIQTTATPKSAPRKTTSESKTEPPKNIVADSKSEPAPKVSPPRRDSSYLPIFLQMMNLAALIVIAVFLWQWHQPARAEYAEFTWDATLKQPALQYYESDGTRESLGSYPCSNPAQVLVVLSWDGWRLAWTDGTRYLVTRPEGHWRHYNFDMEEYKP